MAGLLTSLYLIYLYKYSPIIIKADMSPLLGDDRHAPDTQDQFDFKTRTDQLSCSSPHRLIRINRDSYF